MEGAQPWPDLDASCVTARTLTLALRQLLCLFPTNPSLVQSRLQSPTVAGLKHIALSCPIALPDKPAVLFWERVCDSRAFLWTPPSTTKGWRSHA